MKSQNLEPDDTLINFEEAQALPPNGQVDYSRDTPGREFADVIPFSYARVDHPTRPGQVIPAMSIVQGTWRQPRAVSRHGDVISPATPTKTPDNQEGFEYKPLRSEGITLSARTALGGLMRRGKQKRSSSNHPVDTNLLDIPAKEYERVFDSNDRDVYTDESKLMRLNRDIQRRSDELRRDATIQLGQPISDDEGAQLDKQAREQVLDRYIAHLTTGQRDEIKAQIYRASQMVAERLAVAERNAAAASEKAVRAREIVAAQQARIAEQKIRAAEAQVTKAQRDSQRDTDSTLKAREQDLRRRELDQRELTLAMREEALAKGILSDSEDHRPDSEQKPDKQADKVMQEYLKRKKRWDQQTATIDAYRTKDAFAHLFDDTKLVALDAAIQAAVAPKFDNALRTRIADFNKTLPSDQQMESIDNLSQQEKEQATKKLLTGKERGAIANPIDNVYTRAYMAGHADNADLMFAISWYRRRLTGRSHEPRPPRGNK